MSKEVEMKVIEYVKNGYEVENVTVLQDEIEFHQVVNVSYIAERCELVVTVR